SVTLGVRGSKVTASSELPCDDVAVTRCMDGKPRKARWSGRGIAARTRSGGRSPGSPTTSMRENRILGKKDAGVRKYAQTPAPTNARVRKAIARALRIENRAGFTDASPRAESRGVV